MTRAILLALLTELETRFPELATDEEINGGDAVDSLCEWHEEIRDRLGYL